MYNSIKLIILAAVLLLSTSGCQLDDYLSIPYGTYELKSVDLTESYYRPESPSADAVINVGECELFTRLAPTTVLTDFCFPTSNIELSIERGLTFTMSYVIASDTGFVLQTSSGDFHYNEGFLVLSNTGGGPSRIDYTDNDLTVQGDFRQPNCVFHR